MNLPSKTTLKRYGLSLDEWQTMYISQDGRCKICAVSFESRRACIDHVHVKGWKKMKPEKRKEYVRALLCFQCNRLILQKSATLEKLRVAVKYLEEYEQVKDTRKQPSK